MDSTKYFIFDPKQVDSYSDLGLLKTQKTYISPPIPKVNVINIPGADGSIDLTEALDERTYYENRTVTDRYILIAPKKLLQSKLNRIYGILDGGVGEISLKSDRDHYYTGRICITEAEIKDNYAEITVTCSVEPYRYEYLSSTMPWQWDNFNFYTGIIRDYRNLEINGSLQLTIPAAKKPVLPTFNTDSDNITMTVRGKTYNLESGFNIFPELLLANSEYIFTFNGHGTVTVDYRGADL